MQDDDIFIQDGLTIQGREVIFSASRSSGPGGQHVNKTSTRVTLAFDVQESETLSEEQKALISRKLAGRMDKDGVLKVHSGETRSQYANRELARRRLAELIRCALEKPKKRRPTKPGKAAKRRRLNLKKQAGQKKRLRQKPDPDD